MGWYFYTILETSNDITVCCGIHGTQYKKRKDLTNSTESDYNTCSDLDYSDIVIDSYYSMLKSKGSQWKHLSKLVDYYQTSYNITVSKQNGGCIYQNTNCLTDTVFECIDTFDDNINNINNTNVTTVIIEEEIQDICKSDITKNQKRYIITSVLSIVIIKVFLIVSGIAYKLLFKKHQIRHDLTQKPSAYTRIMSKSVILRTEIVANNNKPTETANVSDHNHSSNQSMDYQNCALAEEDDFELVSNERNNDDDDDDGCNVNNSDKNNKFQCSEWCANNWFYIFLFAFVFCWYLWKLIYWILKKCGLLLIFALSSVCSVMLFLSHHSPILSSINNNDFCNDDYVCKYGQQKCGVVRWIVNPDIGLFFIPGSISFVISFCAFWCRCIERCSDYKRKDMINKEISSQVSLGATCDCFTCGAAVCCCICCR